LNKTTAGPCAGIPFVEAKIALAGTLPAKTSAVAESFQRQLLIPTIQILSGNAEVDEKV
jgi:hypothetical protein